MPYENNAGVKIYYEVEGTSIKYGVKGATLRAHRGRQRRPKHLFMS